jgi:argininosuccinate synthase
MLSNNQRAALDAVKLIVNRSICYQRCEDDMPTEEAVLTIDFDHGKPVQIHGEVQTLDELEYAVAKLIATARKEVGHGRAEKPIA